MHFILTLLLTAASAKSPVIGPHWQCDASGVNAAKARQSVTGEFRSSQSEAEASAISTCSAAGLSECSIDFCFDDGLGLTRIANR